MPGTMAEHHDLSPRGVPTSFGPTGFDFSNVFGESGALRSPFRGIGETEAEQAEAGQAEQREEQQEQQTSRRRRLDGNGPEPAMSTEAPAANAGAQLTATLVQQLLAVVQAQTVRMGQLEQELAQSRPNRAVPPSPPGLGGGLGGQGVGRLTGGQAQNGGRASDLPEGKIPFGINLPAVDWKSWKGRTQELVGFRNWFETFVSWLNLINEIYPLECREAVTRQAEVTRAMMSAEQWARSQRLLTFVRQSFAGWTRIEGVIQHYISLAPAGEGNGFEALRLVHKELSLQNRAEALALRTSTLALSAKSERLAEIVRSVEGQLHQFDQLLDSSAVVRGDFSLRVSEADKVIVLLKQLPQTVRMFVQLHGRSNTFEELKQCVLDYDTNTRLLSDVASLRVTRDQPSGGRYRSNSRDSKGSKGSKGKGKGANSGLCWNCGKAGHRQKDCPDPPKEKGKGRGKKSDGGKGGGSRDPSRGPKKKDPKDVVCFKCKKKGHFAKDCPQKDRARSATSETEDGHSEGDAQLVMALKANASFGDTSSRTRETEAVVTARVADLVSRLPSSNVSARVQWLVDSGATSHIVGSKFLSHYKVRQKHSGVKVELFAANGQQIANEGLVDLELVLPIRYPGKSKTVQGSVILQKCIVADIEFNVLSPFVLLSKGWKTILDNEAESALVLKANDTSIPLTTYDRAWWLYASGKNVRKDSPRRSKNKDAMDVDVVTDLKKDDPVAVDVSAEVKTLETSKEAVVRPSQFSDRVTEVGRLTFLLRGLRSEVVTKEPVDQGELVRNSDAEMSEDEDADQDLGGLPPPEAEEAEEAGDDGDPEELAGPDLELGPGSTYDHLCKGHYPYLKSCRSCARANGKLPARRLVQPVGKTEVGADFGFLGRLRFLVIVVMYTQMVSMVPMSDDRERDLRNCNLSLKELGLTGKHIHLRLDGESFLGQFMRSAAKGETFPGTGLSFWPTPPERSPANGLAEKFVEAVKCGAGSNLLFLEERMQRRIPFESGLVKLLLSYVARMRNLYHCRTGSDCSALDRLRGRKGSKLPRTFPFGCRMLGKLAGSGGSKHDLERLSECVYLGPIHTGGGGFWGKLAGGSLVGKEPEEAVKIVKFSGGRIVVPVKWYVEDFGDLLEGSLPANVPMSGPPELGPQEDEEGEMGTEGTPLKRNVPGELLTPPKGWVGSNGGTPGCIACKQIQETGKSHSRVHSKGCRRRYTKWASEQREVPRSLDPGVGSVGLPDVEMGGPVGGPMEGAVEIAPNQVELDAPPSPRGQGVGVGHPTGGQRYYGKRPPAEAEAENAEEEEMEVDILGGSRSRPGGGHAPG